MQSTSVSEFFPIELIQRAFLNCAGKCPILRWRPLRIARRRNLTTRAGPAALLHMLPRPSGIAHAGPKWLTPEGLSTGPALRGSLVAWRRKERNSAG